MKIVTLFKKTVFDIAKKNKTFRVVFRTSRDNAYRAKMVLDDPFASVDPATEKQIFANMKELCRDSVIVLLSHRLSLFPELDQVVWLDGRGGVTVSDHASLMEEEPAYRELFLRQTEGGEQDA